jgi:MFS family permease
MGLLPLATSFPELLAVLVPVAMGSSALQVVPTAYVTDLVPVTRRAQALSLFRTCGDVGLLVGAALAGLMADAGSFAAVIYANAGLMAASTCIFTLRHYWGIAQSPPHKKL